MELQKLKEIINNAHLNENWQMQLLNEIAKDTKAINYILIMLNEERNINKELITDLNSELSRAHLALVEPKINKDDFVQEKITEFYKTGRIKHCFKMEGLE